MRRVPFAVLVLPYAVEPAGEISYSVFRDTSRHDSAWHVLAGDGARGETPLQAARRHACGHAAVPADAAYLPLDSRRTIELPDAACGIAEHAFAVRVCVDEVRPRRDRIDHRWVSYKIAEGLLDCQAQRHALWELRHRLGRPATCV